MTLGDSSYLAGESYLGIGRETAFGTYVTATAGFDFISASLKTMKDSKILPQVERKRTMSKVFQLGKTVEGNIDTYFTPDITATAYILQNAFGGTVTSATATGETAGGAGFTHTFVEGSMDQTYKSLSVNHRKGGIIAGVTSTGKVWRYVGGKINTLSLVGELDEPLKMSMALIFKDSTTVADDIEALMTATAWEPLSFAGGRFSVEGTFASLTSSSFWHVQSINFTLNNNLKNDNTARRIGSDVLAVLPVGIQSYELQCTIRFDTMTAYDAMIAGTEYCAEFEFLGSTYSASVTRKGLKVQFQKLTVKDAGDPEISGPDEVLTSNVVFNVLRDESATGYAVRALLTNNIASV
jgi:hypothetical protein